MIMVIRHAEKASEGRDGVRLTGELDKHSLTVKGWQRAGALAGLFAPVGRPLPEQRLRRPEWLLAEYADAPGSEDKKSEREEETIAPLAAIMGAKVDLSFGKGQYQQAAAHARSLGGVVLMVWEHSELPQLARAISNDAGILEEWPRNRYDVVLVFRRDGVGEYSMEQVPEMLLAGDSPEQIR